MELPVPPLITYFLHVPKALERINKPIVIDALHHAADSREQSLKIYAIAALLRRNDISKLEVAEKLLTEASTTSDQSLLSNLAISIENITNPQAVPVLSRLTASKLTRVRQGAAYSLRHIGNNAAIDPLSKLLYDNVKEVRYHAVMGLAKITGQDSWGPSMNLYDNNEQLYLDYWRKWARQR